MMNNNSPQVIEFEVSAADIARGKRHSPWLCPVALAIKRKLGLSANDSGVGVNSIWSRIGKKYYRHKDDLRREINSFDECGQMTPCKHTIELI